nr:phospholipase D/Transphosphatidylase [Klebsiella pneumoniae]
MGHGLRRRCREGVLAGRILLNYVVWGNGSVSARLWNAIRSDDWAIPHVSLSSLGEIVVWARPDDFRQGTCRRARGCGHSATT